MINKKSITVKLIALTLLYGVMFLLVYYSKDIAIGIGDGINISISLIIPSLFVFMVIANIITNSPLKNIIAIPFLFLSKHIYRIDKNYTSIVILSLVGGYPIGAKLISDAVSRGEMSPKTAEVMLCYCVNAGPAFLISGVGAGIFNNIRVGIYLFLSQVIASLLTGFILSLFCKKEKEITIKHSKNMKTYSQIFVNSVVDGIQSIIIVCGFVVFFSGLLPVIRFYLDILLPNGTNIINGMLEVSSGVMSIKNMEYSNSIVIAAIFTSFGGLCVYLQILAMVKKYNIKTKLFLLTRPIYMLFSVVTTISIMLIDKGAIDCISLNDSLVLDKYSSSIPASIFLILLCLILLFFNNTNKVKILKMKQNVNFINKM